MQLMPPLSLRGITGFTLLSNGDDKLEGEHILTIVYESKPAKAIASVLYILRRQRSIKQEDLPMKIVFCLEC